MPVWAIVAAVFVAVIAGMVWKGSTDQDSLGLAGCFWFGGAVVVALIGIALAVGVWIGGRR